MATYDELIAAARSAEQEGRSDAARLLAERAVEMRRGAEQEESDRTQASDIARGMGAGVIGLGQGVAELGALGLDALLDTDYSQATTDFFVGAKEGLGLDPETTAGKAAEAITNFGLAFLPVAGWLGRASQAARGVEGVGRAGRLGRAAETFGQSAAGRALLGSRARLAATTTLAGGVSDFFVSPEGMGTLADAFDALPVSLQTEEDTGLTGRDEAFRRLRNKIRMGAEGTAFGAAFETLFPAARMTAAGIAQIPGVPQAAGFLLRGMESAGNQLTRIPGVQRLLTARGEAPEQVFLDLESTRAFVDTATSEADASLREFDAAARKFAPGMFNWIKGKGRAGLDQAYDDLFRYLQGTDDALKGYDAAVQKPAKQMRDQISRMSAQIAEQVANSNVDANTKKEILDKFAQNTNQYVRRLYRRFEDPNFVVDEKVLSSPLYKKAVDEVQTILQSMDEAAVRRGELVQVRDMDQLREAAAQQVQKQIGLNLIDTGLDPIQTARVLAENVKKGRERLKSEGKPLYEVAEGLLKARSRFMEEAPSLRELMGEIKDPKQAYLRTVGDMAQFVASNRLYEQMGRAFGGTADQAVARVNSGQNAPMILSGPGAEAIGRQLGYKQLGSPGRETIFGGSYGSLTGSWVAPEMYHALTMPQQMTQGILNETLALALQAKGASQAAKTVYSPITQVRNFMSGVFLTLANGNVMRGMPFSDSFRLTAGKAADLSDAEFRRLYELTGNLGLRDQNISVNEYRNLMREGSTLKYSGETAGGLQKLKDKIPFANALERTYAGTDTFWKLVNWNAERAKYANAFRSAGLAPDALDQIGDVLSRSGLASRTTDLTGQAGFLDTLAGDIVKNTQPTYSRVPEGIKMLRRIPVAGNFVAFPAEVIRNTTNIIDRGLREMSFTASDELVQRIGADAARKLERQIRAIGAQRVSGYMASAIAIPTGIQMAAKEVLGWDDQQMEDLQRHTPYFMDGHQIVPLTPAGDPDVEYIDLSYMMPYDYALAPARAAMEIYAEKGSVGSSEAEQIRAATFAGLGKLLEPFASESLIGERLLNVTTRNGVTPTGQEIYDRNSPFSEKVSRSVTHVLGGFIPGAADLVFQERAGRVVPGRVTRAVTSIPSPSGQPFDTYEEAAALVTGLRPMQIRLPETFRYKGFEYGQARRDAANIFGRAANANDSTEQDVIDAYVQANERAMRAQAQLHDLVNSAKRLGLSRQDIIRELVDRANVSRAEAADIIRGKFRPISISDERVQDVIQEGRRENRVITRLPVRELRRIEREFRNQDLPSVRFDVPLDQAVPAEAQPQAALPQTQGAAPAAPVIAPMPTLAVPQSPQVSANGASVPALPLLGADPISQLRNAEIAQRIPRQ